MTKTQKIIIGSVFGLVLVGYAVYFITRRRKKTDQMKNYIIGDSQTPFIDRNSTKASRVAEESGEAALWKGGMGLSWLKGAVEKYPVSSDVNSIIINIGTNGGFSANDDVNGLVSAVKTKFPNAKLFAVQGSWGWGGNKNITTEKVAQYYDRFNTLGVKIIEPPIGSVNDPHGNLPVYAQIGQQIDNLL
jgi:hypothetical protein